MDGALHVLCGTDSPDSEILGYRFDGVASTWTQCDDVSEGVRRGASAPRAMATAHISASSSVVPTTRLMPCRSRRIKTAPGSRTQSVDDQSAADPPQIAILNGRIHCIFNDNTATRALAVVLSRPVLAYSLSSWMGIVPDDTLLFQHDYPWRTTRVRGATSPSSARSI